MPLQISWKRPGEHSYRLESSMSMGHHLPMRGSLCLPPDVSAGFTDGAAKPKHIKRCIILSEIDWRKSRANACSPRWPHPLLAAAAQGFWRSLAKASRWFIFSAHGPMPAVASIADGLEGTLWRGNTCSQFGRVRLVPDILHTHEHTVRKDAGNVSWKWDFCIHDANFARSICL